MINGFPSVSDWCAYCDYPERECQCGPTEPPAPWEIVMPEAHEGARIWGYTVAKRGARRESLYCADCAAQSWAEEPDTWAGSDASCPVYDGDDHLFDALCDACGDEQPPEISSREPDNRSVNTVARSRDEMTR